MSDKQLLVKAIRLGYYGEKRQREGAEFSLKKIQDYSPFWMKPLNFEPPKLNDNQKLRSDAVHAGKDVEDVVAERKAKAAKAKKAEAKQE